MSEKAGKMWQRDLSGADAAERMLRVARCPDALQIDPFVDAFVRAYDPYARPWAQEAEGDLLKAALFYLLLTHTSGLPELVRLVRLCRERADMAESGPVTDLLDSQFSARMEEIRQGITEEREQPVLKACVLRYDRCVRALRVPDGGTKHSAWLLSRVDALLKKLVDTADKPTDPDQKDKTRAGQADAGANTEKEEEQI